MVGVGLSVVGAGVAVVGTGVSGGGALLGMQALSASAQEKVSVATVAMVRDMANPSKR